ncbi:hypothetical protein KJ636_04140 [Patescibacteria group bacterium]|nr:hypothetical protein [Patescibacteria group bacterium]MBU4480740.1 hypothetical protein [Patescibacteria group bacterium]
MPFVFKKLEIPEVILIEPKIFIKEKWLCREIEILYKLNPVLSSHKDNFLLKLDLFRRQLYNTFI